MGYAGGILRPEVDADEVYEILRSALRQVKPERPWRGRDMFSIGPYVYRSVSHGPVERFWGIETIAREGHVVYQLRHHGGVLC